MGDIVDTSALQMNLFDAVPNRKARSALMNAIDALNQRYGPKTIKLLAEGEQQQPWQSRGEYRSQNYLTNIHEILTIKI